MSSLVCELPTSWGSNRSRGLSSTLREELEALSEQVRTCSRQFFLVLSKKKLKDSGPQTGGKTFSNHKKEDFHPFFCSLPTFPRIFLIFLSVFFSPRVSTVLFFCSNSLFPFPVVGERPSSLWEAEKLAELTRATKKGREVLIVGSLGFSGKKGWLVGWLVGWFSLGFL